MAEEFGIKGATSSGSMAIPACNSIQLLASTLEEMLGMLAGAFHRPWGW